MAQAIAKTVNAEYEIAQAALRPYVGSAVSSPSTVVEPEFMARKKHTWTW